MMGVQEKSARGKLEALAHRVDPAFWQRAALACSWPRHTILRRLGRGGGGVDRKLLAAYWWCLDRRDRVEGRSYDLPF